MKQFKLTLLLTVLMSMVGAKAFAQYSYDFEVDGIYYRITSSSHSSYYDSGGYYISYDGEVEVVNPYDDPWNATNLYTGAIYIPSTITRTIINENVEPWEWNYSEQKTYAVTSIGWSVFAQSGITSIYIPESIKKIGEYAFSWCNSLNNIMVDSNLSFITTPTTGYACEEGDICIADTPWFKSQPNGIVYLGKVAYRYKGYGQSVSIKQGTERIGYNCFSGQLISDIPSSVKSIGHGAFRNCRFTSLTLPINLSELGSSSFEGCEGLTDITIPDNVKVFYASTFSGCGLSSLTIGKGVKCILRGNRFVYIYSGYEECENEELNPYSYLYGLTDLAEIEKYYDVDYNTPEPDPWSSYTPRYGLDVQTIKVTEGNTVFDSRDNCNAVVHTKSNTLVMGSASTTIPNNITAIGWNAFKDCNITSLSIPSSVKSMGVEAFRGSKLKSITIPSSLSEISKCAFANCVDLTSVTIDEGVTSIGECAFACSTNLAYIYIPNTVSAIGKGAFYNCSGLSSVTIDKKVPLTIEDATFSYRYNATLYVPAGCKAAYEAADYWKEFKEIVELSPNIEFADANVKALCVANWDTDGDGELSEAEAAVVTSLGTIFKGNKAINSFKELNYFTGLTIIGKSAFEDCSNLVSITIPNNVTTIGNDAFNGCSGFTSLTIPSNVTNIGNYAFCGCSGITSLNIPNSVIYIGECTFSKCSSLASIKVDNGNAVYDSRNNCNAIIETTSNKLLFGCKNTVIPNNVTSLGIYAFWRCIGMTSITIPNSVTSIDTGAFAECSGLTAVTIPNSVTSIATRAFYDCSGLGSIVIPSSVSSISGYVFAGCSCLTSITIPNNMTSIDDGAFWGCSSLSSITIPNSVTSIGSWAFNGCSSLTSIILENEIPLQIASNVFSNRANATLYVPAGCKAAYEAADYWKEFKEIVEMGPDNEPGDLNGDGIINGIDLVAQTNLIMTDQYNAAADLNNDGFVNGLDYVIMVNMIMSFTSAPAMQAAGSNRAAATSNLSIEDFDIKAGETKELFINLSNPNTDLTLLQFDLRLPEGLSIATEDGDYAIDIAGRTTWKKHSLMAKDTNGITRFLLASNTNALIDGNDGNVISIKLTASDGFTSGDICLENQLLVSPDAEDVIPADFIYSVGGTTSIDAMGSKVMQLEGVYDLQGRRVKAEANSSLFTLHSSLKKGVYIVNGKKIIVK